MRTGPNGHGAELTGFRRFTWWAVPGTCAFMLVLFTGDWIVAGDLPAPVRALGAAALAVEVASCVVLLGRRLTVRPATGAPPIPLPAGWLAAGGAAAAVMAAIPLSRYDYGVWAVAPAIMVVIAATYLPPRRGWLLVAAAAALAPLPGGIVSNAAADGHLLYAALFPAGLVAFTGWTVLGPLWAWDTAGRLNEARMLSAELAVKDERLRFAADLHDIQGHHLQVIALKSELAARLAEVDPARAAAEMAEVRQLAADALSDTRAVVQGYRRTTLDEEIANATRVLAAAGIDARMSLDPAATADLDDTDRHLLGLVMREATTNVLRHSAARNADVDYRIAGGTARLRVGNDGADGHPLTASGSGSGGGSGSGLATLAERLRAAGGELAWDRDGDRFTVAAALPAGEEPR
ncbi:two-component system sensor histidine kinase DesK [Murinocardiopsis flavida]|uniref:Two-component system sensor histidine kinase DesK n=1 Tax=Murinocardiopsis flavida TaxID=645275 RepID=A0A2P8DS80_9ACTN|nr:histidine kinase [Murinocardiopsis flavida]PSL00076.1 two-component system sensor histidine kinase DesK [Murinocardiopsis flavida]